MHTLQGLFQTFGLYFYFYLLISYLAVFLSWPSTKSQGDFLTPWYSSTSSQSAFSIVLKITP